MLLFPVILYKYYHMKTKIFSLFSLISFLVASIAIPQVAFAQSTKVLLKIQEDAKNSVITLDLFDDEINDLLEELDIKLQPTDTIWQDQTFVAFIMKMQDSISYEEDGDIANALLSSFDAYELAIQIDHKEFVKTFAVTNEEYQLYLDLREDIDSNYHEFAADPAAFLIAWYSELFIEAFQAEFGKEYEEFKYNTLSSVYGFVAPSIFVEPGQVVYLRVANIDSDDINVTWSQATGPAVEWLTTDNPNERSFVVPHAQDLSLLTFDMVASNGKDSIANTVYIKVLNPEVVQAQGDPIEDLYIRLLGRSSDEGGHNYWTEKYQNGMTLSEIEHYFTQSEEYKQLYS